MTETDPTFVGLYKKYLLGRISGFATRIPTSVITEGFYLPSRNFEYRCDAPPEEIIWEQMLDIRQGARPPLHLYSNPNPNLGTRFLCPDDVAVCIAYKSLNLNSLPAIVFGPGHRSLPFSSFESKVRLKGACHAPRIYRVRSAEKPSKIATKFGNVLPNDPVVLLQALGMELCRLVARLRLFHVAGAEQLHYHHMLFSAVLRAQETLQAIEILIEKNLWYQALALIRVLYEIHLNFYFDWLQPEINYKFLAAATVFNASKIAAQKRKMSSELMSEGWTSEAAEDQSKAAWQAVILASSVAEKGRLPKVGILYHKEMYEFLSQISHQDFEVASLRANRFDDETFLTVEEDLKCTSLRFMDYIVSEFVECVDDDIGTPV